MNNFPSKEERVIKQAIRRYQVEECIKLRVLNESPDNGEAVGEGIEELLNGAPKGREPKGDDIKPFWPSDSENDEDDSDDDDNSLDDFIVS